MAYVLLPHPAHTALHPPVHSLATSTVRPTLATMNTRTLARTDSIPSSKALYVLACPHSTPAHSHRAPTRSTPAPAPLHTHLCTHTAPQGPLTHTQPSTHSGTHSHTPISLQICWPACKHAHTYTRTLLTGKFSGSIRTKANLLSAGPPRPHPTGIHLALCPSQPHILLFLLSAATKRDPARDRSRGTDFCSQPARRWEVERTGGERTRRSRRGTCLPPFGCFPVYGWFDTHLPLQPPERSPGQPDEAPGTGESL